MESGKKLGCALLWTALGIATPLQAQDAPLQTIPVDVPSAAEPVEPAQPETAPALEEVVVTAQKRAESLQDTPISVVAFNADALEQRSIDSVDDLAGNVPGITIEPFPTQSSSLRLFIRGVGVNESQVTQDPAVGVYADGVYIARSSGLALDVADLERIEVLRGPQGTLYGRNTTGGAINLITKRPDPGTFSMKSSLGYGSRNALSAKSTINLPLTDDAAVKLAVLGQRQNGFVDNTGPGGDFGDRRALGLKFDARWLATSWLTADYSYDYSDQSRYSPLFQSVLRPASDKGSAELIKGYAELNTLYSSERLEQLATGAPLEESTTRISGHALMLDVPLGEQALKYIVSYRDLDDGYYTDLGGGAGATGFRLDSNVYAGPAAFVANGGPTPLAVPELQQHQWSHELQFSGRLFDEQLQYITGLFYFSEKATDRTPYSHQLSSGIAPAGLTDLLSDFPELTNQILSLAGPRLVVFNFRDYRAENQALALFGQGTWTPEWFDRRLHLTLGYRHSSDERSVNKTYQMDSYIEGSVAGLGTALLLSSAEPFDHVQASQRFDDDSFSYMAGFELTREVNLYAKYVEGYKSGGFNLRDPQVSGASGPASDGTSYGFGFIDGFAPEHVASTEVGIKSEWFGRRLRLNADVFNTDYEDMQINFLIPGTLGDTKTRNAGKARIRGAELDAMVAATRWLRLSAEYSYLDARVLEVRDISGANVADLYPFASAPRHSGVVAADASLLARSWGEIRGYVTYSYTGEREGGGLPGRSDLTLLPEYHLINARLGINAMRLGPGTLDLAVYVRNLTDEEYPVAAVASLPHTDRAILWGDPRSFGTELVYRW